MGEFLAVRQTAGVAGALQAPMLEQAGRGRNAVRGGRARSLGWRKSLDFENRENLERMIQ